MLIMQDLGLYVFEVVVLADVFQHGIESIKDLNPLKQISFGIAPRSKALQDFRQIVQAAVKSFTDECLNSWRLQSECVFISYLTAFIVRRESDLLAIRMTDYASYIIRNRIVPRA